MDGICSQCCWQIEKYRELLFIFSNMKIIATIATVVLFIEILYVYLCVPEIIYVHIYTWQELTEVRTGSGGLRGTGGTGDCESQCHCWELNPGPLQQSYSNHWIISAAPQTVPLIINFGGSWELVCHIRLLQLHTLFLDLALWCMFPCMCLTTSCCNDGTWQVR